MPHTEPQQQWGGAPYGIKGKGAWADLSEAPAATTPPIPPTGVVHLPDRDDVDMDEDEIFGDPNACRDGQHGEDVKNFQKEADDTCEGGADEMDALIAEAIRTGEKPPKEVLQAVLGEVGEGVRAAYAANMVHRTHVGPKVQDPIDVDERPDVHGPAVNEQGLGGEDAL